MKNQKGFSLIELLIVVVIIGIIAAIAIPNLLASRRAANEASAQSSARVAGSGEATYYSTSGNSRVYGTSQNLCDASLIDGVLASSDQVTTVAPSTTCVFNASNAGPKAGYNMSMSAIGPVSPEPAHFLLGFNPSVTTGITQTGYRRFCMADDGVLRADATAASLATAAVATTAAAVATACTTSASGFNPTN